MGPMGLLQRSSGFSSEANNRSSITTTIRITTILFPEKFGTRTCGTKYYVQNAYRPPLDEMLFTTNPMPGVQWNS